MTPVLDIYRQDVESGLRRVEDAAGALERHDLVSRSKVAALRAAASLTRYLAHQLVHEAELLLDRDDVERAEQPAGESSPAPAGSARTRPLRSLSAVPDDQPTRVLAAVKPSAGETQ